MSKFKVGDFAVFHPERVTKISPETGWQFNVPTTPMEIISVEDTIIHLKDSIHTFHEAWLEPAKFEFREKGLGIERVLFNDPATIVFWTDGTKTVVKCRKGDKWDAEKGLAMACAKKLMGNRDGYHKTLATYYKKERVWEEEMDTEQIRAAVSNGCRVHHGCSMCPCNPLKGGACYVIGAADREQLITMLKKFEDADKWSYEDWRMRYA